MPRTFLDAFDEKQIADMRKEIYLMAKVGVTHDDISKIKKLSPHTLRKHFKEELAQGLADGKKSLMGKAFQMAMTGQFPAILIFLLKTRCGLREVERIPEISPGDKKSPTPVSTGTKDPVEASKIYQRIMSGDTA